MAGKASVRGKKTTEEKATTKKPAARATAKAAAKTAVKTPAKTTAKTAARTTSKGASARKINKGDKFVCGTCGLSMVVDECGDVVAAEEIICCGKPMKQKTSRAGTAKK